MFSTFVVFTKHHNNLATKILSIIVFPRVIALGRSIFSHFSVAIAFLVISLFSYRGVSGRLPQLIGFLLTVTPLLPKRASYSTRSVASIPKNESSHS